MKKKTENRKVQFTIKYDGKHSPNLAALKTDLENLCEKHGLRNAAFCASDKDDMFHGMLCVDVVGPKASIVRIFEAALNVGRLWQASRDSTRESLNKFEPQKKW